MATTSHDNHSEEAPSSVWRRALGVEGSSQREAIKEFGERFWYCVYIWWRRAGLDPISTATATVASFNLWADDKPPHADDSSAARMREWTLARLPELAEQGVKLKGEPSIQIDQKSAESRYAEEPEGDAMAIFQRRWALTVIEITTVTLRDEYTARGEESLYEELHTFAGFDKPGEVRYATAAERLGKSTGAVRAGVFELRTRQREIMLRVVTDTVLDPVDAESEITALLCACDAPGPDATSAALPSAIQGLNPDEILMRAMNSVRMTQSNSGEWQPPTIEEMKRLFSQYEVVSLVGRGGMGAVYKARQIELDREVAIKLLPLEISVDANFADRFRREARAMAKLQHPNIILVYEFGTTSEGHLFFVMEFVDGADLHQMIHGPGVTPAQTLKIIVGVCDALAYAHEKGVVHRDIKPANIMVSLEEEVKVADFGLARLLDPGAEQMGYTMTGTVMGTPDYMAPEQMGGMDVDHRADIYSLGVMLYEMLCGEVPRGIFEPASERCDGVGTRIDQVVTKAMQQQPDSRYQTTTEMKTDVAAAREPASPAPKEKTSKAFWKRPARAKKPRVKKTRPKKRRHKNPISAEKIKQWRNVILASAAALALACGIWMWAPWSGSDVEEPADSPPRKAGERMVVTLADGVAMAFRWCPPGKFVAGSPETELGRRKEGEDQREVELTQGFWIGETEVTQAQWMALMEENPSQFLGEQRPVERVPWKDSMEFCNKLTSHIHQSGKFSAGLESTLPTEAQWEYACRAGTQSAFNNGKELTSVTKTCPSADEVAWYGGNTDKSTHDVGLKKPNRWGLHDMHGNVKEWCIDFRLPTPAGGKDPRGPVTGKNRVIRGGSFAVHATSCRTAYRSGSPTSPGAGSYDRGFRVVILGAEPRAIDAKPSEDSPVLSIDHLEDKHKPGDRVIVPIAAGVEMAFRWCPPGSFVMGSLEEEPDRTDGGGWGPNSGRWAKKREVELTQGFWMGETEVTQNQWEAIRATNPSSFKGAQKPVGGVNWEIANEFCDQLTEQVRKSGNLPQGWQASLPTEAQWEYACRAGTKSALYSGKDSISPENVDELGWYLANSRNETHDVGQKTANQWGLYDMCGNVWEWCLDWFGERPQGRTDPTGPAEGSMRVARGSGYDGTPMFFHSAYRYKFKPGRVLVNSGLRLVLIQVE